MKKTPCCRAGVRGGRSAWLLLAHLFVESRGGSAVVCGPGPSAVAHQADECVDLRDVERLEEALGRLF